QVPFGLSAGVAGPQVQVPFGLSAGVAGPQVQVPFGLSAGFAGPQVQVPFGLSAGFAGPQVQVPFGLSAGVAGPQGDDMTTTPRPSSHEPMASVAPRSSRVCPSTLPSARALIPMTASPRITGPPESPGHRPAAGASIEGVVLRKYER